MTPEETIELGLAAEAFLASSVCGLVVQNLNASYINNIVTSAPEAIDDREHNYNMQRCLWELVGSLSQLVSAKNAVVAATDPAQDPERTFADIHGFATDQPTNT